MGNENRAQCPHGCPGNISEGLSGGIVKCRVCKSKWEMVDGAWKSHPKDLVDTLRVLYDKVLVEPIDGDNVTPSGIVVPDGTIGKDMVKGKVVATGEHEYFDGDFVFNPQCKIGDIVYFQKKLATLLDLGKNNRFYVVSDKMITAVVDGEHNE